MGQAARSKRQPRSLQGDAQFAEQIRPDALVVLRSRDQRALLPLLLVLVLGIGARECWRRQALREATDVAAIQRPYRPRIAINSCDWPELCVLPGISETRARHIIEDRQVRGPFVEPHDLQRVSGIGPKTQARLTDWLDFSCSLPPAEVDDSSGGRPLH